MVRIIGPESSPHVRTWRRAFVAAGAEVTGLELGALHRRRALALVGGLLRCRLNLRRTADVTVVHSLGTYGLFALLVGLRGRVVVVPWGSEVFRAGRSGWHWVVAGRLVDRADLIVVTSRAMADEIQDRWPGTADRIEVVSWGVDLTTFRVELDERTLAERRARWGFSVSDVVVVSARGAKPIYRPETIEKAFVEASRERPGLRLVLAGYESADGRSVNPAPIGGGTVMLGWQTKAQLAELYSVTDAVISVPVHDQRSTSVLEAAACGALLLLSPIPANFELLDDGLPCFVLARADVASTAAALVSIQHRRQADRAVVRKWIEENEDQARQMRHIVKICCGPIGFGSAGPA